MDEEIGPGDGAQGRFGSLRDPRPPRDRRCRCGPLVSIDKIQGERGEPLQAGVVSRGVPQTADSGKVISGEHKAVKSGRAIGGKGNAEHGEGGQKVVRTPPGFALHPQFAALQQEVNAA